MPDYIVIRLHPTAPTTGAAFTAALQNLVITADDISFNELQGEWIGQAQYNSTIVQHPDGSGGRKSRDGVRVFGFLGTDDWGRILRFYFWTAELLSRRLLARNLNAALS